MRGIAAPSSIPDAGCFAWGRAILARSGRLPLEAIALLLKHNPVKPLPDDLREAAIKALRRGCRPGRKLVMGTAQSDFKIAEARELYEKKRIDFAAEAAAARREAKSRGDVLPRTGKSPSERALDHVLEEMSKDFGTIDRRTLRNLFSLSKCVRGWEAPDS